MKKLIALLLIPIFSGIAFVSNTQAQEYNTECMGVFMDVNTDDVFCTYIEYLYHQEVVSGQNGEFLANENITRGQVAKVVQEAFQIPTDISGDEFPDVPSDHTFYEYIMSLKNAGVISGYEDGQFHPDDFITRAEITKMIVFGANDSQDQVLSSVFPFTGVTASEVFPDVQPENKFSRFIMALYSSENLSGYSDGSFKPDQFITRGEVSKIFTNTMKYVGSETVKCKNAFCQDKYIGDVFTALYDNGMGVSMKNYDLKQRAYEINNFSLEGQDGFKEENTETSSAGEWFLDVKGIRNIILDNNNDNIYFISFHRKYINYDECPEEDKVYFGCDRIYQVRINRINVLSGQYEKLYEFDEQYSLGMVLDKSQNSIIYASPEKGILDIDIDTKVADQVYIFDSNVNNTTMNLSQDTLTLLVRDDRYSDERVEIFYDIVNIDRITGESVKIFDDLKVFEGNQSGYLSEYRPNNFLSSTNNFAVFCVDASRVISFNLDTKEEVVLSNFDGQCLKGGSVKGTDRIYIAEDNNLVYINLLNNERYSTINFDDKGIDLRFQDQLYGTSPSRYVGFKNKGWDKFIYMNKGLILDIEVGDDARNNFYQYYEWL